MHTMSSYLELLKDSNLVWDFQRYFGVHKVMPVPTIRVTGAHQQQNGYATNNGGAHFAINDNGKHEGVRSRLKADDDSSHNGGASSDSAVEETVTDSDSDSAKQHSDGYVITRKFWFYLFSFGTALGDELFYASFFPFWFWNIDGAVGRRVVMVWVMVMYVGQGLKDVIRWPRPFCPPAIRLEKKWALEYGMPSTHAMVGIGVPFSVLYYTMYRYEYPVYLGLAACTVWCVVVCCSRIYMGMHTVLDIVGGLGLAVILLSIFLPLLDSLDNYQLTNPYAPITVIGTILLLAVFYPTGDRWTPARGDTTVILGTGAGCSFGSWLNFQLGIIRGPSMPPPYKILWPTYEMIGLTLLRTVIGILIVVATRAFFRSVSYIIVCWVLRLDRRDVQNTQKIAVELSCKFITYAVLGFNATYLCPAVFRFLNIERITMFTEV